MDHASFVTAFASFKQKILNASGTPFKSFREGLPAEWEAYKPVLRENALARLNAKAWNESWVGTGKILSHVIDAIEIEDKAARNNLVGWVNRFGHAARSHRELLDAVDKPAQAALIERRLLKLYGDDSELPVVFDALAELVGKRYDLLAYLFFLRDSERFMPIAPTSFDKAFEILGIDLVTTRKCSWSNYEQFVSALKGVRDALETTAKLPNVRLIDAHSFCWMLVKVDDQGQPLSVKVSGKSKSKKDPGRVLDARERSIVAMANEVEATVKASMGPAVEKQPKLKLQNMTRQQLIEHLRELMVRQEDRCALTGIAVQFHGEQEDAQLLPSLDRIDSNGHYEKGNLQVVCRFVNFWKRNQEDAEFRRLLAIVRGEEE
jgi:hypothetical protein